MKKNIFYKIFLLILVFFFPIISYAQYDPGFVIADNEMYDYNSMTELQIHNFLLQKGSGIVDLYFMDFTDSKQKRPAQIIYEASQENHINPKVVLVTLQKEQSLVQNPYPSQYNIDWAMGYGMCDSCTVNTPGIDKFIGFVNQVKMATKRISEYTLTPAAFNYRSGFMYQIDSTDVLILNQATANLYNYTPHISGNHKFYKIWNSWFSQTYPNGTLLKSPGDATVWLIQYGMKRPITSMSVLASRFDMNKIITVSKDELLKYEQSTPINFPQYSLLSSPDNKKYLLVNDALRLIESDDVFRKIGFNSEELTEISWEDMNDYEIGENINMQSVYPLGTLLQNKATGGVYYVHDGIKHPIYSKELLKANFAKMSIIPTDEKDLTHFTLGDPVIFKDGELIKSGTGNEVFVIENGYRRPVISGAIFEALGYKWGNIIITSQKAVDLHPLGDPIDKMPEN